MLIYLILTTPYIVGTVIIPTFQMRKLRQREVRKLVQVLEMWLKPKQLGSGVCDHNHCALPHLTVKTDDELICTSGTSVISVIKVGITGLSGNTQEQVFISSHGSQVRHPWAEIWKVTMAKSGQRAIIRWSRGLSLSHLMTGRIECVWSPHDVERGVRPRLRRMLWTC